MCCLSLKVVKCVIILLNILYVITGLMLLITGIAMMVASGQYRALLPNIAYLKTAYLLIFIGIVIFISAAIGCCLRDTKCCVLTFYFLIVFVICLEVSVIILGYIGNGKLRERIDDYSKQEMISDMVKYNGDNEIREAWDQVQREEGCCGVREASDWYNGIYGDRPFKTNQVPNSCCSTDVTDGCGVKANVEVYAKVYVGRNCPYRACGCGEIILNTVHEKLGKQATIALLSLLIQIFLVLFVLCWYYMLFRNKTVHWCCSCCVYEMVEIEDDEKNVELKTDSV